MKSFVERTAACALATVLLLQALISASAADLVEALVRYTKRDYAGAIVALSPLADLENAVSQEILGNIYSRGEGVPRDHVAAFRWYLKAASQGRTEAQIELGVMYRDGLGTSPDGKLAMHWFQAAADRGVPHAFNALGELYLGHSDIRQNYAAALDWFLGGAHRDNFAAIYNISVLYALGRGVVQDEIEAYKWLELAANVGIGDDRAKAVLARTALAERLTPFQVSTAKLGAREWLSTGQPTAHSTPTPHAGQAPAVLHRLP